MTRYLVTWDHSADAESPTDAADKARRKAMTGEATLFTVVEEPVAEGDDGITIDLGTLLPAERRVECSVDSGDHEVGKLRYRYIYEGEADPADALERASTSWLAAEGIEGTVSPTEALDSISAEALADVGLRRVEQPYYEEVSLDDG
jgi:hypothetical protein